MDNGSDAQPAKKQRNRKPLPPAAAQIRTPNKRTTAGSAAEGPPTAKKPRHYAWGVVFMLFRLPIQLAATAGRKAVGYVRCSGTVEGHVADSAVHRYEYEVGFLTASRTEEDSNPAIKNANRLIRQLGIGPIKSHDQRVTKWALFEP